MDLAAALAARDGFAEFAAAELGLPCFLYGPERSFPRCGDGAFHDLAPDLGPAQPDPSIRRGLRRCPRCRSSPTTSCSKTTTSTLAKQIATVDPLAVGSRTRLRRRRPTSRSPATWSTRGSSAQPSATTPSPRSRAVERPSSSVSSRERSSTRIDPSRYGRARRRRPDRTIEARLERLSTSRDRARTAAETPRLCCTRARRTRRRSRSLMPPQIPNFSPFAIANSRQSTRTTQPRQTSLASRVDEPRSGKNRSGSTPMQFAR